MIAKKTDACHLVRKRAYGFVCERAVYVCVFACAGVIALTHVRACARACALAGLRCLFSRLFKCAHHRARVP